MLHDIRSGRAQNTSRIHVFRRITAVATATAAIVSSPEMTSTICSNAVASIVALSFQILNPSHSRNSADPCVLNLLPVASSDNQTKPGSVVGARRVFSCARRNCFHPACAGVKFCATRRSIRLPRMDHELSP